MSTPGASPSQRVGDADRERAAEELRLHHLEGRLEAEELEERLGAAYAARTFADLATLLLDLPERGSRAPVPVALPPVKPPRPGGFGLLAFSFAHDLPVTPERAYADALDSLTGALQRAGYTLVERVEGQALVYEAKERPDWVPLVCIFAFPIGLLALGVRRTLRVRIDVLPRPAGGSRLRISGEGRRQLRKAFANLLA